MWYHTVGYLIIFLLLMAPLTTDAQPAGKSRHIGWLRQGSLPPPSPIHEPFLHSLRDMGYVESQNLSIAYRSGNVASLPALATELVRLPVEVLVVDSSAATLAAKEATSTIPVVFMGIPDPVDRGIIPSWAQPGGNITGVANADSEFLRAKQFELLKEVVPAATRVAWLGNPDTRGQVERIRATARLFGLDVYLMDVRDPPTNSRGPWPRWPTSGSMGSLSRGTRR